MTTRVGFLSMLAALAGGGFVLTGVLLPAVTASRAVAQDLTPAVAPSAAPAPSVSVSSSATPAPVVAPAPSALPVPPVPPLATPSVPALPPTPALYGDLAPPQRTEPITDAPLPVRQGADAAPQAGNFYFSRDVFRQQAWPEVDPEQAAELQQIVQKDTELEGKVRHIVGQYHSAGKQAERDKLRAQATELLDQQFSLRQKRRTLELENLEARVRKLREAVSKREAAKQTIIDRRLAELLHDDDGLGWGDASPSHGPGFGGPARFNFTPGNPDWARPGFNPPAPQPAVAF